jgi:hypothetical protein
VQVIDRHTNTILLLGGLVLIGVALAGGAVLASAVPAEEQPKSLKQGPIETPVPCPDSYPPATSRDAEAQALVDSLDEAIAAARKAAGHDVQLYNISSYPGVTFRLFYSGKGGGASVDLDASGQVINAEPSSSPSSSEGFRAMKPIDDVRIGPSAAIAVAKAQQPDAEILGASLWRGGDCRLAWRNSARTRQRMFTIVVDDATGEIRHDLNPPSQRTPAASDTQQVIPRKTPSPEELAEKFKPGKPWDSSDPSEAEARRFADYPLFWFGSSIRGYNLQRIGHSRYTTLWGDVRDEYSFVYGQCERDPGQRDGGCQAPAFINVQPVCAIKPEDVAQQKGPDGNPIGIETIGAGALLHRSGDGAAAIWTGQVRLTIGIVSQDGRVTDADLAQLRGLGRNTFPQGGQLPPPDFSACP